MPPTIGVPDVQRGFTGTTGRSLFPLTPANSTAIFSWIWTLGSGSLSSNFITTLTGMAGMYVDISTRFLDCVGPVDPLFGLLIVAGLRYGQRSPLFVWFVCFCRMSVFRIHLEDPVTVKTFRNKRNNTLCDVWLSCSDSLALGVMDRLGTMEQCLVVLQGAIYCPVEPPF